MLVAFWKAATSFPDFFYFQKRVFFSFLFCFLFICICCILKIGNLVSCFFLLLLYFQKRVFSSIFCFLSHLLLSHFEKRHPLSSFFHMTFLLITIYFSGPPSHGSLFKWVPMRSLENIWTTNWWKTAHFSWVARM